MADKSQKAKQTLKFRQNMKEKQKKMPYKHKSMKDEGKERWKKKVMYGFKKAQRKERHNHTGLDVQKLYEEMSSSEDERQSASTAPHPSSSAPRERFHKKKEESRFSRAQSEYQQKAQKKQQKYEEMQKKKQEQEAALQNYKEQKKAKYKKMCKKTSRGQPLMKFRVQLLLDQIEKQKKQSQGS